MRIRPRGPSCAPGDELSARKSTRGTGIALRGSFVTLDEAPTRSKPPGPTFVASSDHLPRGEHGGSVPLFVREGSTSPGDVDPFSLSQVRRNLPGTPCHLREQNVRNP